MLDTVKFVEDQDQDVLLTLHLASNKSLKMQCVGTTKNVTPGIKQIIEDAMRRDDETTATQIQSLLATHGVYISLSTITRARHHMGWIY